VPLVNLTPHPLTLEVEGRRVELPPAGPAVRVRTEAREVGRVEVEGVSVPVVETVYGALENLPEPQPGTLYVVSLVAAQAAARLGRADVVAPDTGPTAVRDAEGRIVAVRRLVRPA